MFTERLAREQAQSGLGLEIPPGPVFGRRSVGE